MKKLISKFQSLLSLRKFLLAVLLLCSAFCLYACNTDEDASAAVAGFTVSGQIVTIDGCLANVSILKNGEDFFPSVTTNTYGIFSAFNLIDGDILSFERYGYSFSPNLHTVSKNLYDLRVTATEVSNPSSDASEDENPQEGDNTEKATLSLLSNNMSLITDVSGEWSAGAVIPLTAIESDGWSFVGWYQSNILLDNGTSLSLEFTLLETTTIEARFESIPLSPVLLWNEESYILSWSQCENVVSYNIYDGETLIKTVSTLEVVLEDVLETGEHIVYVEAIGDETYSGRASRKTQLTLTCKERILSAKNTGFLQNNDGKFLIFGLSADTAESDNYADGFALQLQKDNAIWCANIALSDFENGTQFPAAEDAAAYSQMNIILEFSPSYSLATDDLSNFESYSLSLLSALSLQTINGVQYNTLKFDIASLTASNMFDLISLYNNNIVAGTTAQNPDLDSLFTSVGDYIFTVTATTQNENLHNSEPVSMTYAYSPELNKPSSLVFSDDLLYFCDTNSSLLTNSNLYAYGEILYFEIILNGVKVATISSDDCVLSASEQTETQTHCCSLSNFLPENSNNLSSISIRVISSGYISSNIETLFLVP
ncbi:MAG: hypothetical protein PHE93_04485 [Clostridia bacterium]|nr:hypothetical protein [Clostridia bacterium]